MGEEDKEDEELMVADEEVGLVAAAADAEALADSMIPIAEFTPPRKAFRGSVLVVLCPCATTANIAVTVEVVRAKYLMLSI